MNCTRAVLRGSTRQIWTRSAAQGVVLATAKFPLKEDGIVPLAVQSSDSNIPL